MAGSGEISFWDSVYFKGESLVSGRVVGSPFLHFVGTGVLRVKTTRGPAMHNAPRPRRLGPCAPSRAGEFSDRL